MSVGTSRKTALADKRIRRLNKSQPRLRWAITTEALKSHQQVDKHPKSRRQLVALPNLRKHRGGLNMASEPPPMAGLRPAGYPFSPLSGIGPHDIR